MGMRIELDVALRPSAEGGVVVDAGGRAIGMAVFGPRKRVLVIPAPTIERVASQLDRDGRIARGYLGLGLQPVRREGGGEGAMVMSVDATGPGSAAGVRQGDIIVGWNGQALRTVAIVRELGPASVGTVARVSATRAGEPVEFSVTIGARPDA
jgi:S1-C subfamily serine protease